MSQRVTIDYQSISMETIATCETVEKRATQLIEELKQLQSGSTSIKDERRDALMQGLKKEIDDILSQTESLKEKAVTRKSKRSAQGTQHDLHRARDISTEAQNILRAMDELSTERLATFKRRISKNLSEYAQKTDQRQGAVEKSLNSKQLRTINSIEDVLLKDTLYEIWSKNPTMTNDEALNKATSELTDDTEKSMEEDKKAISKTIVDDMKDNKVDNETINKVVSESTNIKEMRQKASEEIVDESVRRQTIKAIANILKKQGFIIDKKNIKLRKDKNEVYILAQKASGEYAEFRVYLDGKFVYEFEGYEGQACQEDIEPFMNDLKSIYDVDVTNKEIEWSNPDKHQKRHYQSMNQNRNKQ